MTSIGLPPSARVRALRGRTVTIRYVVTGHGTVDAASIEVPAEFPESFAAEIRSSLAEWTFTPARAGRAGQCWMRMRYAYRLTL